MRLIAPFVLLLCFTPALHAQSADSDLPPSDNPALLPDAPSSMRPKAAALPAEPSEAAASAYSSSNSFPLLSEGYFQNGDPKPNPQRPVPVDANGNPIPLNRQQPQRILGFMPNFRSVAAGSKPPPPGWKYNFKIATHQAFDYSSFIFLGITSLSAEGINSHPVLGKGVHGFYSYTWRGFLDKTDGTYLGGWFLPSLLHEDTRYFPLGDGHRVVTRALYVISRQGVARTYSGRNTPNIAGLGGKVLTQLVSRQYYPAGATDFSVLATKFAYSAMRDIGFSSIREFYPDIAAHYIRKHREKVARIAAAAANQSTSPAPVTAQPQP